MVYLYAFFTLSVLNAVKDIAAKQSMKGVSPDVLAGTTALGTVLFCLPFLLSEGIPQNLTLDFLWAFLAGGTLYYTGKYFNFSALQLGDISLISPMKGLVTVCVVFSSFLLLGEVPTLWGMFGIISVFLGTYFLATQKEHRGILEPIRYLISNPGARLFLFATIAYSFTVTIDRIGVLSSSIWFWTTAMNASVFLFSLRGIFKRGKKVWTDIVSRWKSFGTVLILHIVVYVSQMWVVSQILAPYTSSLKTASSLFAVVIGGWFFQEKDLVRKFIAALIILLGVGLISFLG